MVTAGASGRLEIWLGLLCDWRRVARMLRLNSSESRALPLWVMQDIYIYIYIYIINPSIPSIHFISGPV